MAKSGPLDIVKEYATIGVAATIFVGLWWSTMTPTKTNLTIIAALVLFVVGVLRHHLVASQPILPRIGITLVLTLVVALAAYYMFWVGGTGVGATTQRRLDDILKDAASAPVSTHTFSILLQKGATFSLGPCPNCLDVTLGNIEPHDGTPEQEFIMRGDIFTFSSQATERINEKGERVGQQRFGFHDEVVLRNAPGALSVGLDRALHVRIALLADAEIEINTKQYQIRLVVVDTTAASLRIRAEVRTRKNAS
jgi:hypothetical protein